MRTVSMFLAAAVVPAVTAGEPGPRLKPLGTLEGARPTVLSSAIAFSPDGKLLAAPTGVVVQLWDVDQRRVVVTLRHPFGDGGPENKQITGVAFSPDGKLFLTWSSNGTVRLWDVATGKAKDPLKEARGTAYRPGDKTLATWLMLLNPSKRKGRPPLEGLGEKPGYANALDEKPGYANAVVFSPDGKNVAVGGGYVDTVGRPALGWVRAWEVATGRLRFSFDGREFSSEDPEDGGPEMVQSLAFSPDGKTLATASVYGSVLLWDLRSGKRAATLQAFDPDSKAEENFNPAFSVAFSPDGGTLAVGTLRGLRFWDVKSGRPSPLQGPPVTVWSVAFRRDGKTLATAEAERKPEPEHGGFGKFSKPRVRLWELPASLPVVQESEGEKLFRAMEKKISEARAFQVTVEVKIIAERDEKGKERGGQLKGALLLTKDNKARLTIRGKVAGEAMDREYVADGKHIAWKDNLPAPPYLSKQTAPKKLHARLSSLVTRAGLYGTTESISVANGYGPEIPALVGRVDAWDFKAGAAAKVGGRDARVVRYKVGLKGEKGAGQATLWIDAKTLLPLKYVLGDRTNHVTEIYHEFILDPKTEARVFALPK
jgi:hypothetical protein